MNVIKNDTVEITTDDLGYNGEGIGHIDGAPVFIAGALSGERVRAKIIAVRANFAVGKLLQILEPSPDRVTPQCSVFGKCGGCTLQHLKYDSQLKVKKQTVQNAFLRAAGMSVVPDECVASDEIYGYRNKFSVPVRAPRSIGFYAQGSHVVVPVCECPVNYSGNGKLLSALCEFMDENELYGYDESSGKGDVRHLTARRIDGLNVITVVTPRRSLPQIKAFDAKLQDLYGKEYALYLNYNSKNNNVILGERSEKIGGNDRAVCVDGLNVRVHPNAFFQVNDGVRAKLYAAVKSEVSGVVLEGYSGAGILSAQMAETAEFVYSVEREKQASDAARQLIADHGITNVQCFCGDCAQLFGEIVKDKKLRGKRVAAVVDPPRAGCDRSVLEACAGCADKIVYVSCNPATLARDVKLLCESGFTLSRLTPFDMFPQTSGVECLAVLKRE